MDALEQTVATLSTTVHVGDLSVDLANKTVHIKGERVQLDPSELQIMMMITRHYVSNPGEPISKDSLLTGLYPKRDWKDSNILEVRIFHIRRKIGLASDGKHYIETLVKKGYKLRTLQPVDAAQ